MSSMSFMIRVSHPITRCRAPDHLPVAGSDFGAGGEDVASGPKLHVILSTVGATPVDEWRPMTASPKRSSDKSAGVPSLLLKSPRVKSHS